MKPLLAAIERPRSNGAERGWHHPPDGRTFDAADLRNRAIADGSSPNAGREVHFGAPRTLIFLEGDDAESVFRVTDGLVMLYKLLPDGRRQVVELIGKGDVFGFSRFRFAIARPRP